MSQACASRSGRTRILVAKALVAAPFVAATLIFVDSGVAQTWGSEITQQWLDQKLVQWRPTQNAPLSFQVFFNRASYGNIEERHNTLAVQRADLSMLVSTNAQCIRMDIGYAPWVRHDETTIGEVTSLVHAVRASGKCLVIADAASESYRQGGRLPWAAFKRVWLERVSTLASLYHPDYYIVVKEPGWYVPMVADARTDPSFQSLGDWLGLTAALASAVLSVSPRTRVGIALDADALGRAPSRYVPYLTGSSKLSGLFFLGFDIYTVAGFNSTLDFLTTYGSGDKAVWIAEAWSDPGSSVHDASRTQLDREWVRVLYYFALRIHATAVMPFYTDVFASYRLTSTSPTEPSRIVALYRQRTPVFYEYQGIVSGSANIR